MTQQAIAERPDTIMNGVNVTALKNVLKAVQANKDIADFQFRARNTWLGGDANRTTIQGFYGACQEDTSRAQPFVFDNGEPAVLLGKDRGANPVEFVLHALAGCVTTTMAYHAAARGIEIEAIESRLEGDLDLRGFLGLSNTVRKGYHHVRVHMRVKSKAAPETLAALAKYSPVYDIVSNSLPVELVVETY